MKEEFKVVYSPEALDDIRKIYSYIAYSLKAPNAAQKQVSRIKNEIISLALMPERYALVDREPWKSMNMHKVTVNNYVVYYVADEASLTVTIIRVFYAGRDVENIFKELSDK